MKKNYNQFTKSDMPLDNSLNLPTGGPTSSSKQMVKKPKINAIGAKATSKAEQTKTSASKSKTATSLRNKLSKSDVLTENLEKLNEESIQSHSFRSKRNQVVIILLSIMLALSIAFLVVYLVVTKVDKTCYVYTHGDAEVAILIDGEEISEFAPPANLTGNCIFNFNADLNIKSAGTYNIRLVIECYYNDELLNNIVIYEPNLDVLTYNNAGYYNSKTTVTGNQTISLCQGVAINELGKDIEADGFTMEIHVYVERA